MAIITDPDLLDRIQVIFGTTSTAAGAYAAGSRTISMSQVGLSQISGPLGGASGGSTTSGANTFVTATDLSGSIAAGDILCVFSGGDQGHYLIESVSTTTISIDINSTDYPFTAWAASDSQIIYDVRDPNTGSITDGVSEQAIYSFAKEEWKSDTGTSAIHANYADDLIRHPFPFEGITPTQFEIGGGTAHDDWDYHNIHTKNLVRNGGWRKVDASSTNQEEYAAFISLGSMDADAQPYYQLVNATTAPTNFAFQGPVNEAVWLYDNGVFDRRTYFKAFLRKKGKTYASYDLLTEQNLSTLTYKDFAFPLTHATDAAITATDGDISGTAPFSGQNLTNRTVVERTISASGNTAVSAVDTNGVYTFEKAGASYITDGVRVGDSVHVIAGNNADVYFDIIAVTATALTVSSADGITAGSGTEEIEVLTKYIVESRTDGVLANVDGLTGTITSATGGFDTGATQVRAGDMVILTESANTVQGVYKVISQDSATQITVDTSDLTTPFAGEPAIDFEIVRPSMLAQYKWDTIVAATVEGSSGYTFADGNPDTITSNNSLFASVLAGDIVTVSGSTNNDGTYTVASATGTVITLIGTDTLTAEVDNTTCTIAVNRGFSRAIAGTTYGFKWRVFGNDARLSNVYQFLQRQLRLTTDIDYGYNGGVAFRGDITDSLLSFASPTGVTSNMYIDDLSNEDTNNITYTDATGLTRTENFVATFTIQFNSNLLDDANTIWTMFFTNNDAGDNDGSDYGTIGAIIVNDAASNPLTGSNPAGDYSGTYDYDNNTQRGAGSSNTDAPITIVAIGLSTAQFVRFDGTISRAKGQTFSLVSALERNYSNA